MPTLVGGMVFQIYIAIPISWVGVNAGAILNMMWIRYCRDSSTTGEMEGCVGRTVTRAVGKFDGLEIMLREDPIFTVFIVRFPFMYNGLLNYVFSVSNVRPLSYAIGNAFGFIPGCAVFSALGGEMKSFGRIVSEGGSGKEWGIFLGIVLGIIIGVLAFKWQSNRIQRRIESRRRRVDGDNDEIPVVGSFAAVVPTTSTTTSNSTSRTTQTTSCNHHGTRSCSCSAKSK